MPLTVPVARWVSVWEPFTSPGCVVRAELSGPLLSCSALPSVVAAVFKRTWKGPTREPCFEGPGKAAEILAQLVLWEFLWEWMSVGVSTSPLLAARQVLALHPAVQACLDLGRPCGPCVPRIQRRRRFLAGRSAPACVACVCASSRKRSPRVDSEGPEDGITVSLPAQARGPGPAAR